MWLCQQGEHQVAHGTAPFAAGDFIQPGSTTQPLKFKPIKIIHLIMIELTDISMNYIPHTVQHLLSHLAKITSASH